PPARPGPPAQLRQAGLVERDDHHLGAGCRRSAKPVAQVERLQIEERQEPRVGEPEEGEEDRDAEADAHRGKPSHGRPSPPPDDRITVAAAPAARSAAAEAASAPAPTAAAPAVRARAGGSGPRADRRPSRSAPGGRHPSAAGPTPPR